MRAAGHAFLDASYGWLTPRHARTLRAIARCRTAALGGHVDGCARCGHQAISYNSCRNRHCPKCQANARYRWLDARRRELLPASYAHVVFTLPHELAPLALRNQKVIYGLLFRASAATLLEVARNPKRLGADIGFFSVLHTWNQKLEHHPHVHCVVPAGGLSPDHARWVSAGRGFFLPVRVLGRVFRGKFIAGLRRAFAQGKLGFYGRIKELSDPKAFGDLLRQTYRHEWVVYSKKPFGGPDHVLRYLGAYTHRVAISNHRLIAFEDGKVTFRWPDSAHKNKKRRMTLPVNEFLRRFLLHLLPLGFVRIRHFGFLANRKRAELLPLCFALLGAAPPEKTEAAPGDPNPEFWACPICGGPMTIVERFAAAPTYIRPPPAAQRTS